MHHSKLPLTTWFWGAYLMATHSNGISALQLQRQLGLGSYRSAWLLCGKLRRSMVAPGRSALAGLVEIDETEISCRSKNDPLTGGGGRSHQGKMLIVGAVEIEDGGAGPGRIRLAELSDYSADSLHPSSPTTWPPAPPPKPMDGPPIPALPVSNTIPMSWARRLPTSSCPGAPHFLQPQGLGLGRLSRLAPQTSSVLSRRVRLSLQPSPHPPCRVPLPARHRRRSRPSATRC
jgi:hypothetical protein